MMGRSQREIITLKTHNPSHHNRQQKYELCVWALRAKRV